MMQPRSGEADEGGTTPPDIRRRGLLFVLSSPSGAGKTTLSRRLLAGDSLLTLSISATTRPRRPGEVNGQDYHFTDEENFRLRVNRGEMLEHAFVHGHHYGTPRAPVEKALAGGRDVLFDIDWQGTQQLAESARDDLVCVFILPPSAVELERRLRARARDPDDVIARRLAKAGEEMTHYSEYDYVVVNHDVEVTLARLQAILEAERLRRKRQVGLAEFVRGLQES